MTTTTLDAALPEALERAQDEARAQGLSYAGDVDPPQAWALAHAGQAVLVDVRSAEEHHFVGHVPGSLLVPWATGMALTRNPRFVQELEAELAGYGGRDAAVLLLCRSGKRSVFAAQAATAAGFRHAFNVTEGFEGEIDAHRQRGGQDGWRLHGLPWVQN